MSSTGPGTFKIAPFRANGLWGAAAKSNTTLLRFREPVYRSLRAYSRPLDLSRFDGRGWIESGEDLEYIGAALDAARHYPVLPPGRELAPADPDLVELCFARSLPSGLYKPAID